MWAKDTRLLRMLSDWIGRLAVAAAIVQLGVGVLTNGNLIQQGVVLPMLFFVWTAFLVALGGLFVMSAGRVLAGIAEMVWFSSPDNPENTTERR